VEKPAGENHASNQSIRAKEIMRTKLILCLAVGLSGFLAGCSSATPIPRKTVVYPSIQNQPADEVVVLKELGQRLSVRVEADSWPALLEKVKPAFAWGGRDMMWIEQGANGQPRFILDEAYIYHPTNQPLRWVLLDTHDAPFDALYGEVTGNNLHGVADMQKTVPVAKNDADEIGEYAIVKSAHPRFGKVYEIGWQKLMANGTCLCEDNRRLYVLQDRTGQWYFIGEGVGEGHGKSGGHTGEFNSAESRVVWMGSKNQDLPVEIQIIQKTTWMEWAGDGDAFVPRPDWTTYDEFVLAGAPPAVLRRTTEHPYLLAEKGDTFDKIAERCAEWCPEWGFDPTEPNTSVRHKQVLKLWRTALTQLNPKLPQNGNIRASTRVQILSYGETVDRLAALEKAESE
jgi:hypothetical protein